MMRVKDQDQLYDFIHSINWLRWFDVDKTIAFRSLVSNAPNFNNSKFVALKSKDALVDQFRKHKGERPSVNKENPDISIHVHLKGERCTVFLDSSGIPLFKRGYRTGGHQAPLNEVLAAGMVLMSGWNSKEEMLLDPMCGSGTILTEAALYARNISPNLDRKNFAFQHWKCFDQNVLDSAFADAKNAEQSFEGKIIGSDISRRSVDETMLNVVQAKVDDCIRVAEHDFFEREVPKEKGVMMMNPPYGERLSAENLETFYKNIGDQFKKNYAGFTAWVLSANRPAMKRLGLRPSQRNTLYNGPLECVFLEI